MVTLMVTLMNVHSDASGTGPHLIRELVPRRARGHSGDNRVLSTDVRCSAPPRGRPESPASSSFPRLPVLLPVIPSLPLHLEPVWGSLDMTVPSPNHVVVGDASCSAGPLTRSSLSGTCLVQIPVEPSGFGPQCRAACPASPPRAPLRAPLQPVHWLAEVPLECLPRRAGACGSALHLMGVAVSAHSRP